MNTKMIAKCLYISTLFSGIPVFAQAPEVLPADVAALAKGKADASAAPAATQPDVDDQTSEKDSVDRMFREAELRLKGVAKPNPEQAEKVKADLKWASDVIRSYVEKGPQGVATDQPDGVVSHAPQSVVPAPANETRTASTESHSDLKKVDDAGMARVVFDRPGKRNDGPSDADMPLLPVQDLEPIRWAVATDGVNLRIDLLRKTSQRLHEISEQLERISRQLAEQVRPERQPSSDGHVAKVSPGTESTK